MFACWEDQRRSLEKDLASVREPGGSLHQLLLSSESSRLGVVSLFRCYSVCHELFLAPTDDTKANIADLLIEMDCLGETIHYLKGRQAANEQQRFTKLYDLGRVKLLEESEKLIEKYNYPLPPHELLSLCRSTNPTPVETDTDEGESRSHGSDPIWDSLGV